MATLRIPGSDSGRDWSADPPAIEKTFRELAQRWRKETRYSSSTHDRILHPAYQEIIGLGPPALPLLLHELKNNPNHWFWALAAIARENPAHPGMTVDEASAAWLSWGKANGIIE